ncbi:MAG: hypothetical protein IIC81_06785 [Chloroflexi bacterium]|nr:hypothetical protein [Chloroflexota bacterium]
MIDAFALRPRQVKVEGKFNRLGLSDDEVIAQVPDDTSVLIVYAINLTNHIATISIVRALKNYLPNVPVVILENTQAVTAYALAQVAEEFYSAGADYVLTGEADQKIEYLIDALQHGKSEQLASIEGLSSASFSNPVGDFIPPDELDSLPFPAWDLFPLENYWGLRFAHGPQEFRLWHAQHFA